MNLRAVVVDDEQLAREDLCYLLEQLGGIEVAGQAGNGLEGLSAIEAISPDVVFLDVQMPGMTGFEVARRLLDRELPCQIVFVTAYDQYAIEAFEVNAVDYLLKPIEQARLEQALHRVARRISSDRPVNEQLAKILRIVGERQSRRDQMAIKVEDRYLLVQADEIVFASLTGDTINVVTNSVSGTSNYRTLDELQARLDPGVFWRVHRSHLVNITKIKEIVPWFSRNYILRMNDSKATEIPVSRSQTKRLRDYLKL
jgi:two-component system LytT family response regulator/two-component system response regulator LytT